MSTTEAQRIHRDTEKHYRTGRPSALTLRPIVILVLITSFSIQLASPAKACGPFSIDPIFVFHESPDLPFREFTAGRIGIIRPTFGRKTLVIAYRYLNGGMFSDDEQNALVEALEGRAPEAKSDDALKAWIAARKKLLTENEGLPEIYRERKNGSGYDFFPNCAKNTFEVATATLKDRVGSYSASDANVKDWIAAQDVVFQNCSGGSHIPAPANAGSPRWLQKDREYQIAAASFYSLNFDEARRRFAQIAADVDSPWQDTARYLVARTLVRQASLTKDEAEKLDLNSKAEVALQNCASQSALFQNASQKLLALVKFRLHPEERLQELARTLAGSGDQNLRQDLIDYVWLVDQFEARILTAEKKRREALKPAAERQNEERTFPDEESRKRYEARERGEIISIAFTPKGADGQQDYRNYVSLDFKSDAKEAEILMAFEAKLDRKLTDEERKELSDRHDSALQYRSWNLSPNRKWGEGGLSEHEDCYDCGKLTFDLMPDYLRADDLTDWMLTLKTPDPGAYAHAVKRWHETSSNAWLIAALIKADKSSPGRERLMREAAAVGRDAAGFPTVVHELARLEISLRQTDAARKLVDDVLTNSASTLPISAKNQFLEQRARLADGFSAFLKYSQRTPVAFYNNENGRYGSLRDQLRFAKAEWSPDYQSQTKAEWDSDVEKEYQDLLPWDQRAIFSEESIDVLNWHFPLQALGAAGRDRAVPDYLQRQLLLAAWTRAAVLGRYDDALELTPDVIKVAPEMAPLLNEFLHARPNERAPAALFVILKFPKLSPYVAAGLPSFETSEESDYYFATAWWCELPASDFNDDGEEVQKKIRPPSFLSAPQLAAAAAERKQLEDLDVGKSYLGKQVLKWAKESPNDPRVPEALYIAYQANENYKYSCGDWEHNQEIQKEAEEILRGRYAGSAWTAKLSNNK